MEKQLKDHRKKMRSHRPRNDSTVDAELNRLRQICELFVPEDVWQSIHLVELIVEQGLDAAKSRNGLDSDDVIVSLSGMLYQILHRYDPKSSDSTAEDVLEDPRR